jgi:hypothetical protein
MSSWDPGAAGVLRLPSGRLIRGRGLRRPLPGGPAPEFAVYLLGTSPPAVAWEQQWLHWPDLWLPANERDALITLQEAWRRSESERVEIACWGGHGRTGTALAIIAVMDGVPPGQALSFVREHYSQRAVETPWQRWYVGRVAGRIS